METRLIVASVVSVALFACGGSGPRIEDSVSDEEVEAYVEESTPKLDEALFDEAVEKGRANATECAASAGAEPGQGKVTLIIAGATGRVEEVEVLSPLWADSELASKCLENAFADLIINRFDGDARRTVDVTIPEPEASE